jgi:hypothetical protein
MRLRAPLRGTSSVPSVDAAAYVSEPNDVTQEDYDACSTARKVQILMFLPDRAPRPPYGRYAELPRRRGPSSSLPPAGLADRQMSSPGRRPRRDVTPGASGDEPLRRRRRRALWGATARWRSRCIHLARCIHPAPAGTGHASTREPSHRPPGACFVAFGRAGACPFARSRSAPAGGSSRPRSRPTSAANASSRWSDSSRCPRSTGSSRSGSSPRSLTASADRMTGETVTTSRRWRC